MRRKHGSLVPLETAICAAAAALRRRGVNEFHGYELAKQLTDISDSRLLTAYGTLYRALGRLEAMGLLESRREDPAIENAAAYLRVAATSLTFTYSLSTCIIFFDRLGDPEDTKRIELLTIRLLGGQRPQDGTWGYV